MATFILLSSLTDEGAKTITSNPDRIKEVNTEVERLGVKVTAQYAVLGPYDFITIVDAPSRLPRQFFRGIVASRRGEHEMADWAKRPRLEVVDAARHRLGLR